MSQQLAVVIATYSRRMRLRLANGDEVDARIKDKRLKPVCGDQVHAEAIANEADWLITSVLPRRIQLTRPNTRGQVEVLAANLELLIVVAAASPKPDWYIVDRYLCAAEIMAIDAAVVFNKIDLDSGDDSTAAELAEYKKIGYGVVRCSATTATGIAEIQEVLAGQCSIIVGQSGVGKSSIINRLTADAAQRTGSISNKTGAGRHTTVNSVMIPIPGNGSVIDSPGVRDYAPALASLQDAAQGFREVATIGQDCRFANCKHLREPGCAVKNAIEDNVISARRYESYKRVMNMTEKLSAGRH